MSCVVLSKHGKKHFWTLNNIVFMLHQDEVGIVSIHCREEGCIVSVHCPGEGCIGLYIPNEQEISRGRSPRDISRAEGNLKVGGDVQPNTSRLEAVYVHSLIINPYQGMYLEIHPCRAGSIDSIKINTSLLMMREWVVHPRRPRVFLWPGGCALCNPIHPDSRQCTAILSSLIHPWDVSGNTSL